MTYSQGNDKKTLLRKRNKQNSYFRQTQNDIAKQNQLLS